MSGIKINLSLSEIPGIGPRFLERLGKLGIKTVRDLIYHFPARYEDFSQIYKISDVEPGEQVTIRGVVEDTKLRRTWRKHMTIAEALIRDDSGTIRAIWFNQPYVLNTLRVGRTANFAGKISISDEDEIYLSHPAYEIVGSRESGTEKQETKHTARLVPIYPETRGLTSKGLRYLIQPILKNSEQLEEWLPPEVLRENNFPEINLALRSIHFPEKTEDALVAKKRFTFENLFLLQLANLEQKLKLAREKAPVIKTDIEHLKKMISELPYELTFSQKKSLWEIIQDLAKKQPMNRLLQGDVGSGKTVVAALAAVITAENGLQTAFMAPTEVLARQHFETLKKLFAGIPSIHQPVVGLLTSSEAKILYATDLESKIKKPELQEKIKNGEVKIAIGTHALIQKDVAFGNLAFIIIDEQHRFGVSQRAALVRGQTQNDNTRTDAEQLLYEKTTFEIRKSLFEVRKQLGLGHKEVVYQKALEEEFKKSGVIFEKEKKIPVVYNKKKIGVYQPDFVIDNEVILELKALPFIGGIEKKQLWNYLRGSDYKLALMANFGPERLSIERVVYDIARSRRLSASGQQLSAPIPHLLSMSATPIPRTLMLTVFGDLDISLITELPAGRKNIVTKIIPPRGRSEAYEFIRGEVRASRQVFVICPRIDKPQTGADHTQTNADKTQTDADNFQRLSASSQRLSALSPRKSALVWEVRSVKEEFEKLSKKIFPDLRVAMLHGQLKPKEKAGIMKDFRNYKIDILVSTSVVEVGVDVPNATIMMIEGADRFGLAQIYQFRGRVGRGEHQSYCFLFTDSSAKTTRERLQAVLEAKNGFELAEKDLKIRGPGEFLGTAQTGFPDTAMSGLMNPELVKASREAAAKIVQKDPLFKNYPLLKTKLNEFRKEIHLE